MQKSHTFWRKISLYIIVLYGFIGFIGGGGGISLLHAQQSWVRTLDKTGYNVASSGSRVFVYTGDKLYRSFNSGANWAETAQSPTGSLTDFYINGTAVFALQEFSGLWRSFDNGDTWQQVSYNGSFAPRRMASRSAGNQTFFNNSCMAGNGNTLYVASRADNVYRSNDAGTTWQVINEGLPRLANGGAAIGPQDMSAQGTTVFLASDNGVFRSVNEGANWTDITPKVAPSGYGDTFYSVLAAPTFILAYSAWGTICRSSNNGASWQSTLQLPFFAEARFVQGNSIVFLVTRYNGVYYSHDDGISWRFMQGTTVQPLWKEAFSAAATDTDLLVSMPCWFGTNCNGVYKTSVTTLPLSNEPFTLSGNAGTPGALIRLTSSIGTSFTTTSTLNGEYSFSGLTEGNYTIVPTLQDHLFSPTNASVSISGSAQSGVNFTARAGAPLAPVQNLSWFVPAQPLGSTTLTLSWNAPSGGAAGYTVVVQESPTGAPPSGMPQQGEIYASDAAFNGMTTTPFSGQVVFNGAGTSVSTTGLTPNTRYSAVAYPYNGSGGARSYFTANPATATAQTLDIAPPPVNVSFGTITLVPATLNFGDVPRNTSYTRTYSLRYANLTTASIMLTPPALWEISVGNAPFSAAPVQWTTQATIGQVSVRARFTPTANGTFSGDIQHSSGSTQASVRLTGLSSPPSITISTLTLRFGSVIPGTGEIRAYRVTYRNLITPRITLTPPEGFTISTSTTGTFTASALTVTTRTTGSFVVYVQFNPVALGKVRGSLLNNNDDLPALALVVEGEGVFPQVALSPGGLDFGGVPVGSCKVMRYRISPAVALRQHAVEICPAASGKVQISLTGPDGPFTSQCRSVSLSGGNRSFDIWVRYCPTDDSDLDETITHKSEPGSTVDNLWVAGFGARPELTVTPTPTNYGSLNLASSRTGILRVRYNFLTLPATITLSSTASHPFEFEQTPGNYQATFTTSATATSGTFSLNVRFTPTVNGLVRSGFAGVCVAANGTTTDTFTLTGTGIGASLTANNNQTLAFGNQFLLSPQTRSFPLRYSNITTTTITVSPTNHPEFLLMHPETGVFSTTDGITLTVGGTPANPVTSTATLFARFLPTGGGGNNLALNIVSANPGNTTSASARLLLSGTGLAPTLNATTASNQGTLRFNDVPFGETRFYAYTLAYRNITKGTITVRVPAGSVYAVSAETSGTWTTGGQTLTITPTQYNTSATTPVTLWVRLTANNAGMNNATIWHEHDGGDPRTAVRDGLALVGEVLDPPITALPSTTINFGGMPIGTNATMTVSLRTAAPALRHTITVPNNLEVSFDGTTFRAGTFNILPPALGYFAMTIRCTPTAVGVINRNITIANSFTTYTLRTTARGATASPANAIGAAQVVDGKYFVENRLHYPLGWSHATGVPPRLFGYEDRPQPLLDSYNFASNVRTRIPGLNFLEEEFLGGAMNIGATNECLRDPACVTNTAFHSTTATGRFIGRESVFRRNGNRIPFADNNTVSPYDFVSNIAPNLREYLDLMQTQGVRVILEVPARYFDGTSDIEIIGQNGTSIFLSREMQLDSIRLLVTTLANHPALLGWKSIAEIENHYSQVFGRFFSAETPTVSRLGNFTRNTPTTSTPLSVMNYMATTIDNAANGNRRGWFTTPQDAVNLYTTVKAAAPNKVVEFRYQVADLHRVHAHLLNPTLYGGAQRYFDALEAETFIFDRYATTPPDGSLWGLTTPLTMPGDASQADAGANYNQRWYGNRPNEPTFTMNRLELGWQYARQLLFQSNPIEGAVMLKTYSVDETISLPRPWTTSCGGEHRESRADEQLFTVFHSAYLLQESETPRVVNMAGLTIWAHDCNTDAGKARQSRFITLFDRYRIGQALVQPKLASETVVRNIEVQQGGNAQAIRRIVRQYGTDGRQYYYVVLINTLDDYFGQAPPTAELSRQRYIAQNNVSISFPEIGIVSSCEELRLTATGVEAVPVVLENVQLPQAGLSQRIRGGVNFGAADVKIYRLEINQPAVTPVTLLAQQFDDKGAAFSSQSHFVQQNASQNEMLPDYWLAIAPNPAHNNTMLRFTLGKEEEISISIKDMLGKALLQPVTRKTFCAGAHELSFETNTLPSGSYICTIQSMSRIQTIPLHIIR